MTRTKLTAMSLLLLAGLCLSEEKPVLRIPGAPFVDKTVQGDGPKATPSAREDCIVGGVNFTRNNGFEATVFDEKKNVFINPSFESGLRYWKMDPAHGNAGKVLCDTDAHSGKYCAHINSENAYAGVGVLRPVGAIVDMGAEYTLSAWIKSPDGKPAGVHIQSRGYGPSTNWAEGKGFSTSAPHDKWQRVEYTFNTLDSNYLDIWFNTKGILIDDVQLEKGGSASEYAGNRIGLDLLTDSPDGKVVDADAKINARLVFRGTPAQKVSVDITVTDFADRELLKKSETFRLGTSGEHTLPLGPDSVFPKGTNIIKVVVKADGQKPYTDFLRLIRFKYADGTAKHRALHGVPLRNFPGTPTSGRGY